MTLGLVRFRVEGNKVLIRTGFSQWWFPLIVGIIASLIGLTAGGGLTAAGLFWGIVCFIFGTLGMWILWGGSNFVNIDFGGGDRFVRVTYCPLSMFFPVRTVNIDRKYLLNLGETRGMYVDSTDDNTFLDEKFVVRLPLSEWETIVVFSSAERRIAANFASLLLQKTIET